MILSKRKIQPPKTIQNGLWDMSIDSVSEGLGVLVFKFGCGSGSINLSLPINEKLLTTIGELAYIGGLSEYNSLSDLIGLKCKVEIKNNKVKSITK